MPFAIAGLFWAIAWSPAKSQAEARPWTPVREASLREPPASYRPERAETSVTIFEGAERPRYAATAYVGRLVRGRFTKILYLPHETEFENEYVVALAASARLFDLTDHLSLEIEANIARRFGAAELWEIAVPLVLRWDGFPWNHRVYTTAALAFLGPSYATEISETERRKSHNDKGSHWLNYFAPEITLSPPDDPSFAFVARVHHRSGMFGLINGVRGGSSYISLGVRYRF